MHPILASHPEDSIVREFARGYLVATRMTGYEAIQNVIDHDGIDAVKEICELVKLVGAEEALTFAKRYDGVRVQWQADATDPRR
jgi:hypothetical protein